MLLLIYRQITIICIRADSFSQMHIESQGACLHHCLRITIQRCFKIDCLASAMHVLDNRCQLGCDCYTCSFWRSCTLPFCCRWRCRDLKMDSATLKSPTFHSCISCSIIACMYSVCLAAMKLLLCCMPRNHISVAEVLEDPY